MKTRSQTKKEFEPIVDSLKIDTLKLYEVNIDFDEASEAWRANKKSIGDGRYKYICTKLCKNNNNCSAKCLFGEDYCKTHLKMLIKNN